MNSRKSNKTRVSQRQRISLRLVIAAGISVLLVTVVLIIYFQFTQNEVSKANNTSSLTIDHLPVDFVIENQVTRSTDTLIRNGVRYKIAKLLKQPTDSIQ